MPSQSNPWHLRVLRFTVALAITLPVLAAQPTGFGPVSAQPLGFPPSSAQPSGFPKQLAVGVLSCGMDFEVTVRSGPSAGLRLQGELYFSFDRAGELKGDFTPAGGKRIPVVGQVQGQLIGLVFDLGGGSYVWGTGTGAQPIFGLDCGAVVGGLFAGPADGDLGDWVGKARPRTDTKETDTKEKE